MQSQLCYATYICNTVHCFLTRFFSPQHVCTYMCLKCYMHLCSTPMLIRTYIHIHLSIKSEALMTSKTSSTAFQFLYVTLNVHEHLEAI